MNIYPLGSPTLFNLCSLLYGQDIHESRFRLNIASTRRLLAVLPDHLGKHTENLSKCHWRDVANGHTYVDVCLLRRTNWSGSPWQMYSETSRKPNPSICHVGLFWNKNL